MITYEWLDKIGHKQAVYLEGKRVGTIKKVQKRRSINTSRRGARQVATRSFLYGLARTL